ncbi:MAG: fimbrillin family protein [Alistipes sp.]|nr:fimbrillin family protein [Alistipes sp.]
MRKIFGILSFAFMLFVGVSCEKEDYLHEPNSNVIKFGASSTRAEVKTAADILEFGVCAEMNLGPDGTAEALEWFPIFENDRISRPNAESDFTYEQVRYWLDYRSYHFFAVYPYPASVARTSEDIMTDGEKTGTKFTYNVPITIPASADNDIMTAYKSEVTTDSCPSSVDMEFEHKLAKINFNIKSDQNDHKYTITEVSFRGVSRTGTLTYTLSLGTNPDTTETITANAENRNVRRRNLSVTLDTDGEDIFTNDGGLLVLPQQFSTGQVKLQISYKYQQIDNNGDPTSDVENLTASVDVPAITWLSGNSYMYNLTLKNDDRLYISTPTVAPWGSPQSGGIIIIK